MKLFAFVLAFVAGTLVTLQIASNSKLKEAVGATIPAAIASSLFGVILLGAAMVVMQVPWPTVDKLISAPWSAWMGGAFGAFYALVTIGLARAFGCRDTRHRDRRGAAHLFCCSRSLRSVGVRGESCHRRPPDRLCVVARRIPPDLEVLAVAQRRRLCRVASDAADNERETSAAINVRLAIDT
jgi:hypothetical protein